MGHRWRGSPIEILYPLEVEETMAWVSARRLGQQFTGPVEALPLSVSAVYDETATPSIVQSVNQQKIQNKNNLFETI